MRALSTAAIITLLLALLSGCSGQGSGTGINSQTLIKDVTIGGHVSYEDREYSPSGYTGSRVKAVRYARVEVVDSATGAVLARTDTDDYGNYSVTFDSKSDTVYIRVLAWADGSEGPRVEVRASGYYAMGGQDIVVSSGSGYTSDIIMGLTDPVNGAFNILDVRVIGAEFVNASSGGWPPLITAVWANTSSMGTYFCPGWSTPNCLFGRAIHILGQDVTGDTDTFDDDVIWHEYGHFLAESFSRDDTPGGFHTFDDPPQDLRLSWSEGWSDHLPGAIKRWLKATRPGLLSIPVGEKPEIYVDSTLAGIYQWIDLDDPGDEPYMYATNEIAVSKVLLDIHGLFGDTLGSWTAFEAMADQSAPATLEKFWDKWLASNGIANLADMQAVYAGRKVLYQQDAFEPDGLADPLREVFFNASGIATEEHVLYLEDGADDLDVIAFNAVAGMTYDLETHCLKNGGDTVLRLLDADGITELGQNDDRIPVSDPEVGCPTGIYTSYSSKIASFAPAITNTYYAEVSTLPGYCYLYVCTATGRYGSYKLRITEY